MVLRPLLSLHTGWAVRTKCQHGVGAGVFSGFWSPEPGVGRATLTHSGDSPPLPLSNSGDPRPSRAGGCNTGISACVLTRPSSLRVCVFMWHSPSRGGPVVVDQGHPGTSPERERLQGPCFPIRGHSQVPGLGLRHSLWGGGTVQLPTASLLVQGGRETLHGATQLATDLPPEWAAGQAHGSCGRGGAACHAALLWPRRADTHVAGVSRSDQCCPVTPCLISPIKIDLPRSPSYGSCSGVPHPARLPSSADPHRPPH